MVSRRPDSSLARSRPLASPDASSHAREPAQHAGRSRFVRHLGALPQLRRRAVPSDLHRREALRANHGRRSVGRIAARLPQLPRHLSAHRWRVERSGLSQQQRFRSFVVSRRRRPQVPGEPALGSSPGQEPLRGDRAAGILAFRAEADRSASEHLRGHRARTHRSAAPLQAQRLLLPAHRRGRHGLGSCGHHGAIAHSDRALRTASRCHHPELA